VSIIAITTAIVIIAAMETTDMTNKYDMSTFSKEKLDLEQISTNFYNYILVFAIFITLVSSIFLIFHNNRLSKLKDLQSQEFEKSQNESRQKTAEISLELEKQKKENLQLKIKFEGQLASANLKLLEESKDLKEFSEAMSPPDIDMFDSREDFKLFKGISVEIVNSNNEWAELLSMYLSNVLASVDWQRELERSDDPNMYPNVFILTNRNPKFSDAVDSNDQSYDAGEILSALLNANDIRATSNEIQIDKIEAPHYSFNHFPKNKIVVKIGKKLFPPEYFSKNKNKRGYENNRKAHKKMIVGYKERLKKLGEEKRRKLK
jgi:hypothetical protein